MEHFDHSKFNAINRPSKGHWNWIETGWLKCLATVILRDKSVGSPVKNVGKLSEGLVNESKLSQYSFNWQWIYTEDQIEDFKHLDSRIWTESLSLFHTFKAIQCQTCPEGSKRTACTGLQIFKFKFMFRHKLMLLVITYYPKRRF